MTSPLTEMQRTLLVSLRDDLVEKGWELLRDNEAGGTLVLTGDGMRVVASLHVMEEKDVPEQLIENAYGNDEPDAQALADAEDALALQEATQ